MKWYVASRTRHQEKIRQIAQFLLDKNEEVVSQWIYTDTTTMQKQEAMAMSHFAQGIHDAIAQTDIFVLISDPEGADMFVELGIALAIREHASEMRVFVVGEHGKRSVMHHHPSITHVKSIKDVFDALAIASDSFVVPDFTSS